MPPTISNGKICYLEIPALDIEQSSRFYTEVFGWSTSRRGDGALTFHDGVEVSGVWVSGRPPQTAPGILIYIMVADIQATIDAIVAHGGTITQPVGADAPQITARFTDPFGNLFGLYQD